MRGETTAVNNKNPISDNNSGIPAKPEALPLELCIE